MEKKCKSKIFINFKKSTYNFRLIWWTKMPSFSKLRYHYNNRFYSYGNNPECINFHAWHTRSVLATLGNELRTIIKPSKSHQFRWILNQYFTGKAIHSLVRRAIGLRKCKLPKLTRYCVMQTTNESQVSCNCWEIDGESFLDSYFVGRKCWALARAHVMRRWFGEP